MVEEDTSALQTNGDESLMAMPPAKCTEVLLAKSELVMLHGLS